MNAQRRLPVARSLAVASVAAGLCGCSLGLDQIGPVEDDAATLGGGEAGDLVGESNATDGCEMDAGTGSVDGGGSPVSTTDTQTLGPPTGNDSAADATMGDIFPDAATSDPTDASAVQPTADGMACANDGDCPQDLGHCRASICSAGRCSNSGSYGLLASQFTTPGAPPTLSAGGAHAPLAIAAAYPYVFVVTTTTGTPAAQVSAFDLTSPVASTPRRVPINNLDLPAPIVAAVGVGTVVYFLTDVINPGTRAYQALAWIDVTTDADAGRGATSLDAHSYKQLPIASPAGELPTNITSLYNALPDYPSGLFLVYASSDHSTYYPTATTAKPGTGATITAYWNQALVTGADVAVESGSRLVAYTNDSQQPKFALVPGAGTPSASVGPQITVPTPSAKAADFAADADGGVLWTSALLDTARDGGIATARLTVLLASGATSSLAAISNVTPSTFIDIENYPPSFASAAPVVAPPVWVDRTTLALGLAATHLDATGASTGVHVVSVGSSSLREVGFLRLPIAPSAVSVASSNTFAYALAAGASASTIYVLAPLCP